MSVNAERPPVEVAAAAATSQGGQIVSAETTVALTLGSLPVGARLVLRCRKDWRDATVAAVSLEAVTLSVGSPTGHTYRVRRAPDSALSQDGAIPVLGEGTWRVNRARYDFRW